MRCIRCCWTRSGSSLRSAITPARVWHDCDTEIAPAPAADFGSRGPDVERALFRMAQEAVENIKIHAGSAGAVIRLCRDGADVTLEIGHEGAGMTPAKPDEDAVSGAEEGFGILSMRERAEQAGGNPELSSGAALPVGRR